MNSKIKALTMKCLLVAAAFALLAPSAGAAAANSCTCPPAQASSAPNPWDLAQSPFYRPFLAIQEEMDRMSQDMTRLMQGAFYAPGNPGYGHEQLFARVNMETTPGEYRITMTTPGLDEKDLKVEVGQDHTLTIRSQKNLVQKTSSGTERSFGSFTQMLTLPQEADTDHLQTSYKNGEYKVTLPRKGADMPHPSEKSERHGNSL